MCHASGCADPVTFTWHSLTDKPLYSKLQSNGSVSLQIFNPLRVEHGILIVCTATCNEGKAQKATKVQVYGKLATLCILLFVLGYYLAFALTHFVQSIYRLYTFTHLMLSCYFNTVSLRPYTTSM